MLRGLVEEINGAQWLSLFFKSGSIMSFDLRNINGFNISSDDNKIFRINLLYPDKENFIVLDSSQLESWSVDK